MNKKRFKLNPNLGKDEIKNVFLESLYYAHRYRKFYETHLRAKSRINFISYVFRNIGITDFEARDFYIEQRGVVDDKHVHSFIKFVRIQTRELNFMPEIYLK